MEYYELLREGALTLAGEIIKWGEAIRKVI